MVCQKNTLTGISIYENNISAIKVNSLSGVTQGCVIAPIIGIILMDFVLRSTAKAIGEHEIKWGSKTLLDLEYADDLSILDENLAKWMNFWRLGNEKINQVDSFTYLSSITSKAGGCSEDVKSRIAKTQGVSPSLKKSLEE